MTCEDLTEKVSFEPWPEGSEEVINGVLMFINCLELSLAHSKHYIGVGDIIVDN